MYEYQVYIANLGKYNEGELVGDWFTFPIDFEEVKERIGLNERYEEYAIHDYEFPINLSEFTSIDELNNMYEKIEELPSHIVDNLEDFVSYFGSLEDIDEDKVLLHAGCSSMVDVAYELVDEYEIFGSLPEVAQRYFNYESFARDLGIEGTWIETSSGMCEILW